MQSDNGNKECPREDPRPSRKSWEAPEVDVLAVGQTELSTYAAVDGITSAS
jgi:hypothetical protein